MSTEKVVVAESKIIHDLQVRLLRGAMLEGIWVTVYLNKGFAVPGRIVDFDNFTILLANSDRLQMFLKNAISSVEYPVGWMPAGTSQDIAQRFEAASKEGEERRKDAAKT